MFQMEKILTPDEHTFKKVPIFLKCQVSINPWSTKQWRIQDFPLGGHRAIGGHQPLMHALFGKNVCENKRIGSCWGFGGVTRRRRPPPPWIRQAKDST